MTLCKRDVQLFMKKLRKNHGKDHQTIKYYTVGEYGTSGMRPHYHIILFNARLNLLQTSWSLGQLHYGTVGGASVGYCLKYISKTRIIPMHQNDDRTPEFSLFSKGLGSKYLTPSCINYHQSEPTARHHLTLSGGEKIAIPRYYKDRLYDEDHKHLITQAALLLHSEALDKALSDPNYDKNRYNEQQALITAFNNQKKQKKGHL